MQWLTPFALPLYPPSGVTPEATPTRTIIPKNLTFGFEAHRASVYGSSASVKAAPFTTTVKDLVREAHARDFIEKPIQSKILVEESPDYHKLLDDIATDPAFVTLRDLLALAFIPFASRQKRSRALPAEGEGEFEGKGAFGSGIHHMANAFGPAGPILPSPQGPTGQQEGDNPQTWLGRARSRPSWAPLSSLSPTSSRWTTSRLC